MLTNLRLSTVLFAYEPGLILIARLLGVVLARGRTHAYGVTFIYSHDYGGDGGES